MDYRLHTLLRAGIIPYIPALSLAKAAFGSGLQSPDQFEMEVALNTIA